MVDRRRSGRRCCSRGELAAARLGLRANAGGGDGVDIIGSQADLEIKRRAMSRQSALLKQGFTTRSAYDDTVADVREAEKELADAHARAANAGAAIAPGEQPSIAAAQAALAKARLDLAQPKFARQWMDRVELRPPSRGRWLLRIGLLSWSIGAWSK